jgi:uncharacterized protein YaaQ
MNFRDQSSIVVLLAVIQAQDADLVTKALEKHSVAGFKLSSIGAFLGMENVTLLIPVEQAKVELVMSELKRNCRQRIEYVNMPVEGQPLPIPSPIPITVGGATIFLLEIDQYLEIEQ